MSDKINLITIKKATQKNKKLQAKIEYESGKQKTVAFGAAGMSDFTLHHDKARKQRYLDRHQKDPNQLDTAGGLARQVLWNKPSLIESVKDIQRRKKIKVVLKV